MRCPRASHPVPNRDSDGDESQYRVVLNGANTQPVVLEHGSAYITLGSRSADAVLRIYENAITRAVKSFDCVYYGVSDRC